MTRSKEITLDRHEVVPRILKDRGDALLIAGLGSTAWDAAAAGDRPDNFYLWGAMGGTAMIGLGLALAQPNRRVLVITGDGELLMGLGGLATIAVQRPQNLSVVVIDNERYGETGMQESRSGDVYSYRHQGSPSYPLRSGVEFIFGRRADDRSTHLVDCNIYAFSGSISHASERRCVDSRGT